MRTRRPTSYAAPRPRSGRARLAGILGLLAVVAGSVLTPSTSYAADPAGSLCTAGGVSVVVDFQQLGGGIQQACDESGAGKTASQVFEDAGFEITPVSSFPGAACRVEGKPAQGGCAKMPPADAYWGLYVDKAGKWTYAPKGADELTMTDGDFVAFSWQGTKTSTVPGVAPVRPTATPSPTPSSGSAQDAQSGSGDAQSEQDSGNGSLLLPIGIIVVLAAAAGVLFTLRKRN